MKFSKSCLIVLSIWLIPCIFVHLFRWITYPEDPNFFKNNKNHFDCILLFPGSYPRLKIWQITPKEKSIGDEIWSLAQENKIWEEENFIFLKKTLSEIFFFSKIDDSVLFFRRDKEKGCIAFVFADYHDLRMFLLDEIITEQDIDRAKSGQRAPTPEDEIFPLKTS